MGEGFLEEAQRLENSRSGKTSPSIEGGFPKAAQTASIDSPAPPCVIRAGLHTNGWEEQLR